MVLLYVLSAALSVQSPASSDETSDATSNATSPETSGEVADPPAELVDAQTRFERALERFEMRDYKGAIVEFEQIDADELTPNMLFAWAQSERLRGNCQAAASLYERFIELTPSTTQAEAAQQQLAGCEEVIAKNDASASEQAQAEPTPPIEADSAPREDDEARRSVDALGVALVGAGAALGLAGGGMLLAGELIERELEAINSYGEFEQRFPDDSRRARNLRISGGVLVGVGVAALVVGAVRLAKQPRRRDIAIAPGFARGGGGVLLTGRF